MIKARRGGILIMLLLVLMSQVGTPAEPCYIVGQYTEGFYTVWQCDTNGDGLPDYERMQLFDGTRLHVMEYR